MSKRKDNVDEKPMKITREKMRGLQETQRAGNGRPKGGGVAGGRRSEGNLGGDVPRLKSPRPRTRREACRVPERTSHVQGQESEGNRIPRGRCLGTLIIRSRSLSPATMAFTCQGPGENALTWLDAERAPALSPVACGSSSTTKTGQSQWRPQDGADMEQKWR